MSQNIDESKSMQNHVQIKICMTRWWCGTTGC